VLPSYTGTHTLNSVDVNESEVLTILYSLDVNKAAGIDICSKVLRFCVSSLLKPICHLFTVSLSTGSIPTQWRTHCVTPIYKSGDKSLVSNYQPISLLCILSKVLEKILYNKIMRHWEGSFTNTSKVSSQEDLPYNSYDCSLKSFWKQSLCKKKLTWFTWTLKRFLILFSMTAFPWN